MGETETQRIVVCPSQPPHTGPQFNAPHDLVIPNAREGSTETVREAIPPILSSEF
jgi:hypothetical protein